MVTTLGAAAWTLRLGLRLRRARWARLRARNPGSRSWASDRRRHVRLAKPTIVCALVGFVGGPLSMAFFRDRAPFETVHAVFATTAVLLFASTAILGRRLETRRGRERNAHALLGVLSLLVAAAAAVAGFVLLP